MIARVVLLVGLLAHSVGVAGCRSEGSTPLQGRNDAVCQTLKLQFGRALEIAEESLAYPGLGDGQPSWRFEAARALGARPGECEAHPAEGSGGTLPSAASNSETGGSTRVVERPIAPWELEAHALHRPLAMSIDFCLDARALPGLVRARLERTLGSAMSSFASYTLGQVGPPELIEPLRRLIQLLDEIERYPLRP